MMKVEVNSEICKSCLYCITFCPKKVLELSGKLNAKGYDYVIAARPEDCVGCKTCTDVCPDAAITLIKE